MDFIVYFSMYFKQYIKNTTKLINRRKHRVEMTLIMGSQLRWLERTPDKREVDGSIPFEPTKDLKMFKSLIYKHIEKYIEEIR